LTTEAYFQFSSSHFAVVSTGMKSDKIGSRDTRRMVDILSVIQYVPEVYLLLPCGTVCSD